MKLTLPLKDINITQPFGVNWVRPGFYKLMGIPSDLHNGVDFECKIGTNIFASHRGVVTAVSKDAIAGKGVEICEAKIGKGYKSIYWHLDEPLVKVGQLVEAGKLIGKGGNTGRSTGPHLHFGLKEAQDTNTINHNNGFLGGIDPAPHFKEADEKWDKSAVYKMYGKARNWTEEWKMRFKNAWIHKQLIARGRHPLSLRDYEVNALVYGAWDFDIVMNDAMFEIYRYMTKSDYTSGRKPFID